MSYLSRDVDDYVVIASDQSSLYYARSWDGASYG